MGVITGTSDINPNLQGYYDRNTLSRGLKALIYGRFLQARPIPKNAGTRINFRRYGSLAVQLNSLTEGVPGSGKKLAVSNIYALLKQYGDYVLISDWVSMTGLDNTLLEAGEVLGEQMGLSMDTLDRDVLCAGTTVRFASGVAARANVGAPVLASDAKAATRILEGNGAKKITERLVAGNGVGTRPVAPAYYAITHTNCRQDWEAIPGFTQAKDYSTPSSMEEEIGSIGSIRVLCTSNGKVFADSGQAVGTDGLLSTSGVNNDVYTTLVFGKNAGGTIPLQKGTMKNIIKKLGSAGTNDALDQVSSSGWKIARATKILNDDFMVRIEHGCTDL